MELPQVQAMAVALGIGLLVGVERERRKSVLAPDQRISAGVRSFALSGLIGGLAAQIGGVALPVVVVAVAALAVVGYLRAGNHDPGLTSELALLAVCLLGALASQQPGLAAGLGVIVALLLAAKQRMHALSRELISDRELHDGLLLAAAALVVLPLLPDRAIDPLGVINPARIWLLVVLVMSISALGHIILRSIGAGWGMPVAGFFAGYVSSTAAVAGFGERVRDNAGLLRPSVAAAMLANLASLTLFVPLFAAVSLEALRVLAPLLGAAGAVLLVGGALGLRANAGLPEAPPTSETRMFRFSHALGFASVITAVVAVASLLHQWLGAKAAVFGAVVAALAELQASGATLAQLFAGGALTEVALRWGFTGMLVSSALAKSVLAFVSGGRAYGSRVSAGLLAMCVSAATAALLAGRV